MNKALNSSKLFFNRYVTGKTNSPKGEDEVVARILDEIGMKCTFCVEIGAGDGVTESVTHLFREQGSDSLLIDAAVAPELTPTGKMPSNPYKTSAGVSIESVKNNANNVKIEAVSAENINNIFDFYKVPATPSFLSMCIQDLEYHIWKALAYRPAVVCIAYNRYVRPDIKLTTPYNLNRKRVYKCKFAHATCSAMADLGVKKGYTLVEVGEYKMFFVANEFASLLTTAKEFQGDWLFLCLKNLFRDDLSQEWESLPSERQQQILTKEKDITESKFYGYDKTLWDLFPFRPDSHLYGDWEYILN